MNGTPEMSQDVKIAVAARDEGKCVECGTTKDLHFDHKAAHGDRDAPGITACHGMTLIRQPYLVMSPPLRRCGRLCLPGWRSAALAHKPVLGRNVPGTSGA